MMKYAKQLFPLLMLFILILKLVWISLRIVFWLLKKVFGF